MVLRFPGKGYNRNVNSSHRNTTLEFQKIIES